MMNGLNSNPEFLRAYLVSPGQARQPFAHAWQVAKALLEGGHRLTLEVRPERRSDLQNRRLWAMLGDIARQVDWYGQKLAAEEWKDVFSAALRRQKMVPGLDGGFVLCGQRTSRMTKAEMAEMQELMTAFGVERGVIFGEKNE